MPPKRTHEFDDIVKSARAEIASDVPKLRSGLDLTADASSAGEEEMVRQVQSHWGDPVYRQDLLERESPERVLQLLLRANGVSNGDGSPMTVHQYTKQVLEPFMDTGSSPFIRTAAPPPGAPDAGLMPTAPPLAAPPQPSPVPVVGPGGMAAPAAPAAAAPPMAAPPAPEAPFV